jgi:RNA recognition motif-containing protein
MLCKITDKEKKKEQTAKEAIRRQEEALRQQQLALQIKEEQIPPNAILFIQNLSEDFTKDMLISLFSRYSLSLLAVCKV